MPLPPPPPGFEIIGADAPPPPPGFEIIGPGEPGPMPRVETPDAMVNVPEQSWGEYGTNLAMAAGQGLTFNYLDEILAGLGKVAGYGDRQELLDAIRERESQFKKQYPSASTAAELTGSLASGVAGGVGALRAIPALARLGGVGGTAASSAALGAPMAALSETGRTEGDESIGEAALYGGLEGAAWGAGLGAAGAGLGRLVGPWITPDAERLRQAGVRLTPGEVLGGYAKRAEDALGSAPFIGHMIRGRKADAVEDLNRAVITQAASPDATLARRMQRVQPAPEVGHDLVDEFARQLDVRYGEIVPRMRANYDQRLVNDLNRIARGVPQSRMTDFRDAVSRHIDNSATGITAANPLGGRIDGRGMQNALGGLRDEGRALITGGGSQAYDRDLGRALLLARDALVQAAGRATAPRTMGDFRRLQTAYAGYARIRDAAGRTGADQGIFTPAQLAAAVRSGDRSAGRGDFARGRALMQDLSGPAKSVMSGRVADSGTPERAALMGAILAPQTAMTGLMAGAPAALLYTRPGRAIFERLAAGSPQTRQLLRQILEIGTRAGAPAAALSAGG